MKKSKIENVKLEQQLITELPLIDTTSSQPFTKPDVVRRLEEVLLKFDNAHHLLSKTSLSKDEYLSIDSIMTIAYLDLYKIYLDLNREQSTFDAIIETIERNAIDNKATISNVELWAKQWREEYTI